MTNRMRRLAALGVAVAIGCGAVACSSSTETSTTSTSTAGSSGTTPGTTAGTTPGTTKGTTPPGSTPGTTVPGVVDLVVTETPYGDAITTSDGLAVYTFDKEADGTIACVDACLEKWPAVLATEVGDSTGITAAIALVERPDGGQQVAIDGHPVYHMASDTPGSADCQGVNGWWIVNPDGTKNTTETPS